MERERINFIPKQYKKEPVTIRLTAKQIEALEKLEIAYNLSRSALIAQCIDFALEHMPSQQEEE